MGLYDGETAEDIRVRKGLAPKADILDWMGSLESAANALKGALALHHLESRGVSTLPEAHQTHRKAGEDVRGFLISQGVYPEQLPTPKKSYQQLLKEQAVRERLAAEDRSGLWSLLPSGDGGGDDTPQ